MATNQTTNYQLNQWEPTDQVLRTDFNADNAKIEAALVALSAASAGYGNCQIETGSYVGAGDTSNSLTFSALGICPSCERQPLLGNFAERVRVRDNLCSGPAGRMRFDGHGLHRQLGGKHGLLLPPCNQLRAQCLERQWSDLPLCSADRR